MDILVGGFCGCFVCLCVCVCVGGGDFVVHLCFFVGVCFCC